MITGALLRNRDGSRFILTLSLRMGGYENTL